VVSPVPGFVVGADVSPFEIAAAVVSENPGTYVSKVEVSLVSPISYTTGVIAVGENQIATTQQAYITVVISNMADDIQAFEFSVGLLRAVLWQYDAAANLQGLLAAKADWYAANQTAFWEDWVADVFDLRTATDFGLGVWSVILGQPTYVTDAPAPPGYPAWGFGPHHQNFGNGNFASRNGFVYQLPTESARLLLRLRYFQLTGSGTVPETNRMLKYLFGGYGTAYLVDHLNMTQTYFFNFPLTSDMKLMFDHFDVLPRPAGVRSAYVEGDVLRWGFGQYHANFANGNFYGG
jgi:hypothetical protein